MKTVSEESGGKWCAICIQRFCLTHSIQPNFELRKLENNSPLLRALVARREEGNPMTTTINGISNY